MKQKKYIVIANWKAFLKSNESISFLLHNQQVLTKLSELHHLIFAPSFVALSQIRKVLEKTNIALAAQDCSPFLSGAHTGDIPASVLKEVGCAYSLVGHQERRRDHHENDTVIFEKIKQLQAAEIIPILCVGEKSKEISMIAIKKIISDQLQYILTQNQKTPLCIAYEPAWSIGNQEIHSIELIQEIFAYLADLSRNRPVKILYGGGVDENTVENLTTIALLDGFLIGSLSTRAERFIKFLEKL